MEEMKYPETQLSEEDRKKVESLKMEIHLEDSQAALQYGVGAQKNISEFADTILSHVRAKDSGYVGDLMTDLVIRVKGLDVEKLQEEEGFLDKIPFLKKAKNKLQRFTEEYEKLEGQIDKIEGELDKARMEMLKDIGMYDSMYEKNLEYFHSLQLYITAGEEKLEELIREELPALREKAEKTQDPIDAQRLRDYEEACSRFEKKLHDLKLSKTIALQTAPQIKLIQNNDKILVDKIQTAILNTIPVWKSQIVIGLGLNRQKKVLEMQRQITDATNDLLLKNAELLKTNTSQTAAEAQRGIVDLETLQKANEYLISSIEETINIQKEGRQKRQEAEMQLLQLEEQLKTALLSAGN